MLVNGFCMMAIDAHDNLLIVCTKATTCNLGFFCDFHRNPAMSHFALPVQENIACRTVTLLAKFNLAYKTIFRKLIKEQN